jgi:hypothetical protein
MTVSNLNYTKKVTLATATDAISTLIHVLDATHLLVVRVRSGVETTLVNDTDYTVTNVGVSAGCTVTMIGQAAADVITIIRDVPFDQEGDYVSGYVFPPEVNEAGHDKAVMLAQQLQEQIDRCMKLPTADAGTDYGQDIPSVAARIGTSPTVDSTGAIVWGTANGSGLAAFGNAAVVEVPSIYPYIDVLRVSVAEDETVHLTVSIAIEGRSYAKILEFLLIDDGGVLAVEPGLIKEYAANAIGGENCTVTCVVSGPTFLVTISGAGLTDTRNVHIRWKIETFNNNSTAGYTEV